MTKIQILVFIFNVINCYSVFAQPYLSLDDFVTPEFIKNAQEYVNLHLVQNLMNIDKEFKTPDGRNWLWAWEEKRSSIINDILSYLDPLTTTYKWFPNWQSRMQRFQELQMDYFHTIVNKYFVYNQNDKPSQWPIILFHPDIKQTIMYSSVPRKPSDLDIFTRNVYDPIATEADIDQVLYFHRPLSSNEMSPTMRKISLEKKRQLKMTMDPSLDSDDTTIYHILHKDVIQILIETRYSLLRQSLTNKRMSDLNYQELLFMGDRLHAQMNVIRRQGVDRRNFIKLNFENHVPEHLRFLSNNEAYSYYMNMDDLYFEGNMFLGYKNRYDNPLNFNYEFDLMSKQIIGQRFSPMKKLFIEIYQFAFSSSTQFNLNDLFTINSYLESLKTWTFWFPFKNLQKHQWINVKIHDTNDYQFIVKPTIDKLAYSDTYVKNIDEMYAKQTKKLHKELTEVSLYKKSLNFQNNLHLEMKHLSTLKKPFINLPMFWTNRLINFFDSANRANVMPLFMQSKEIDSIDWKQTLQTWYGHHDEFINKDDEKILKNIFLKDVKKKKLVVNVDEIGKLIENLFDSENNLLTKNSIKRKIDHSSFTSSLPEGNENKDYYHKIIYGAGGDNNNDAKSKLRYSSPKNDDNNNIDTKRIKLHL